jgi:DNA (cytosine-5)-methyltransferase 1
VNPLLSDQTGLGDTRAVTRPVTGELVLSVFPGVGLLDRGFESAGFCVVRGPDKIFGGDVKKFFPPAGCFAGVIGGPPCQKFSLVNRKRDVAGGMDLVNEFVRIVEASGPAWALMENVPGSPVIEIPGFLAQLFTLNSSHVGSEQNRLRKFHFFYRAGSRELVVGRSSAGVTVPACLATEARRAGRRSWRDFCRLQGLPDDFDLPAFKVGEKFRAVGNGVPFALALALALAIRNRARAVTPLRVCGCGCGQFVKGRALTAGPACRKREQRKRDARPVDLLPAASQMEF